MVNPSAARYAGVLCAEHSDDVRTLPSARPVKGARQEGERELSLVSLARKWLRSLHAIRRVARRYDESERDFSGQT